MISFKSMTKVRVFEFSDNDGEKGYFAKTLFLNISGNGELVPGKWNVTVSRDKALAEKIHKNVGKDVYVVLGINTDDFGTKPRLLDVLTKE